MALASSRVFISLKSTGVLLYGVDHRYTLKRLAEVHFDPVKDDSRRAEHLERDVADEVFGEIHHAVIVGVRLVELHHREFGVVTGVDTLVAEDSAYLIDLFKTADDKALEIKLKRDAELKILVKGV